MAVASCGFAACDCIFESRQFRLLFLSDALEPRGFRFVLAKFALQRQRAGIALRPPETMRPW